LADQRAYARAALAGFLLINPRAGRGGPSADELADAARGKGIQARVLRRGDDAAALAHAAKAAAVGMAGGDGSLAPVAEVAIDRDLPFVCVPFGTRNHFARDLGLDRSGPLAALDAFRGEERRIDVGRAGERLFLNNVSFGVYASLVHRREVHRRRRQSLARLRALLRTLRHPYRLRLRIDGEPVAARVVLAANNAYDLKLFNLGARESLTEGRLHLYSARGLFPTDWDERVAETFELDGPPVLRAAVDGEPAGLETPFECRIEPRALRVLLPPGGERERDVLESELVRGGKLASVEPAELGDVVRCGGFTAHDAGGPVQVQGRLRRRVAAVTIYPDPEEILRLDLEPRLLPQLTAEPGDRVLAFLEEAAGYVPEALKRRDRPPDEQESIAVDAERCGGGLGARVDDEAAGSASKAHIVPRELAAAPRTEGPTVELALVM
jgi:diacylglycerol kinase family enzyme